jgi:quinolinate synthase
MAMVDLSDFEEAKRYVDELKERQDAVLLVHNYQRPWVQDVADIVGDSFGLSKVAQTVEQQNIIFCGVDFMAESALILNPTKNVIHPNQKARCPMAAMVDPEGLKGLMDQHPGVPVVAYVNTTADVKALVDVCCTSSNAVKVIESLDSDKVIFIPDSNLGLYAKRFIKNKEVILWPGYCHTHQDMDLGTLKALKTEHPDATVMVHPECTPEVIDFADVTASTEGMFNHVKGSGAREFIVGTEKGMVHRLRRNYPDRTFHLVESAVCPAMKRIRFEDVVKSLESLEPKISLPEEIIRRASRPLERMVEIGRGEATFDK